MTDWRPIEEYRPGVDPDAAILCDEDSVKHGWYEDGRWALGCEGHVHHSFVPTHWMPWPEPQGRQPLDS